MRQQNLNKMRRDYVLLKFKYLITLLTLQLIVFKGFSNTKETDTTILWETINTKLELLQESIPNEDSSELLKLEYEIIDLSENISKYAKANVFNLFGEKYTTAEKFDHAMDMFKRCIKHSEKIGATQLIASSELSIGILYYWQENFSDAIDYFLKTLEHYEIEGIPINGSSNYGNALYYIGASHISVENYIKAKEYLEKSVDQYESINFPEGLVNSYGGLSIIAIMENELDTALKINQITLDLCLKNELYTNASMTYGTIGTIYQQLEEFDSSIFYLNKEHELLLNFPDQSTNYYLTWNRIRFATLYGVTREYSKCISYANEALETTKSNQYFDAATKGKAYLILHMAYDSIGDHENSLKYLKLYDEIEDQLKGPDIISETYEETLDYEKKKSNQVVNELKEKNSNLNQRGKITNDELNSANFSLNILAIILVAGMIVTTWFYVQKRKWKLKALSLIDNTNNNVEPFPYPIDPLSISASASVATPIITEQKKTSTKYSNSKLTKERKKELIDEIFKIMKEEHLYKESDLNINKLAKRLNTNSSYISQVINEEFDMNFRNFINEFRIQQATKMLADKQYRNLTIEAIAKSTGFNSLSPFNKAFKNTHGITPSFFLKSVIKADKGAA